MWVRHAKESDHPAITSIDPAIDIDAHRRALIAQAITEENCWIAGRDSVAEGYLTLSPRHFFGRDFIALVIVRASSRRQGLASALFQAAESNATTRQLFTSTNQSNRPMQAFLKTRDYQDAGTITHLDEDDPEIIFVKYLRSAALPTL